ncbi:MAG: TlpA family protein disulfide reductase [Candidatus Heimdallarchaeaceae archaeon]
MTYQKKLIKLTILSLITFFIFSRISLTFAETSIAFTNIKMENDDVKYYSGVRLVSFFLPTCPHCVAELPTLKQVDQNYNITIFQLDVQEESTNQTLLDFNSTHELPSSWILGYSKDSAEEDFNIYSVPTLVLLDDNGTLVKIFQGETNYDTLATSIEDALSHRTENYTTTTSTNGTTNPDTLLYIIIGVAFIVGLAVIYFLILSFQKKK